MRKITNLKIFSLLTIIFVLNGCTGIGVAQKQFANIKQISTTPSIQLPELPLVGPSLSFSEEKEKDKQNQSFKEMLAAKKVNFEKILSESAEQRITHINSKIQNNPLGVTAYLNFQVKTYGLVKGWGFTTKPYITILASLTADNNIIWSKEFDAHGYSDTYSTPMSISTEPKNLNLLFSSGVNYILNDMENSLLNYLPIKTLPDSIKK